MRREKSIIILGLVALALGVIPLALGCSDRSDSLEVVITRAGADVWEEEQISDELPQQVSRQEVVLEEVGPDPSILASEFARSLASQLDEDSSALPLFDVARDAKPMTLRVELPGKEFHILTASFDSLREFAQCLRAEGECEVGGELFATLLQFDGITHEGVEFCTDGCCHFAQGRPLQEGLSIRNLCFDEIEDDRLALTELTLWVD